MSKENVKPVDEGEDDLRPEYDLTSMKGGVRGKYYRAYRAGHAVKIYNLEAVYQAMAQDEEREAEALEWAEATLGDASDER